MIKFLLILCLLFNVAYASPLQQYSIQYVIQETDTIDSIAQHFAEYAKIPLGTKQYKAFREGIIEYNYETIQNGLQVGKTIIINYWSEK